MNRKQFLASLAGLAAAPLAGCSLGTEPRPELYKSKDEWRRLLAPAVYAILFEGRTEPAGSSPLNGEWRDGTYVCAACFNPLFGAETKYESGTGWPSFWDFKAGSLGFGRDFFLLTGLEYHCKRCGGHQGHRFDDGPQPTGKRYCNNGLAIQFVPAGDPLPDLRT